MAPRTPLRKRRWTVLIVPEGIDTPRTLSVSGRVVRVLTTIATLCGLLVVAAIGMVASGYAASSDSREVAALGRELSHLREQLTVLQDTIATIGRREEQLRLLAGLPAVDSQVRAMGIGGTGIPELEGDPLYRQNRELGTIAFGARSDIDELIRRANLLAASFTEVTDTLAAHAERLESTPSIMPTAGWLSSHFSRSRKHPILHVRRPHEGIDVAAPRGAPIVAPAAGRVIKVGKERGYGLVLEIDHGNGIVTKYAHMSKIVVRRGQRVTRGQVIANVGNSGLSTSPHLHYEIHVNGRVVDPLTYVLPESAIPD